MNNYLLLLILICQAPRQNLLAKDSLATVSYFHLKEIQAKNSKLSPANLKDSLQAEINTIEKLEEQIAVSKNNINRIAALLKLPVNINPSPTNSAQITELENTTSSMKIYVIIGFLAVAFIGYRLFSASQKNLQTTAQLLDAKLSQTKHETDRYIYELEKEAIRIDNRLVQVLHEQLSIIKEERNLKISANPLVEYTLAPDHRLPIKVGEEIHRMRKRIENMDKETKGLSALVNSINRLGEELTGSGYEMEDLIGKKYMNGMKMEARFVENADIPPGEERITEVLRPEIKYKGEVIQVAKVEVGKSY